VPILQLLPTGHRPEWGQVNQQRVCRAVLYHVDSLDTWWRQLTVPRLGGCLLRTQPTHHISSESSQLGPIRFWASTGNMGGESHPESRAGG